MPLYEYECEACEHRFEKIQKFSDPLVDTCPKCGGRVHKLASSPAIQFKGTGWYITDYAKKDQGSAGKADSSKEGGDKSDASKDGGSGSDSGSSKDASASKEGSSSKEGQSAAKSDKSSGSSQSTSTNSTTSSSSTSSASKDKS